MRLLQANNKDDFEKAMQYRRNSVRDSMWLEQLAQTVEAMINFMQ